MKTVRTRFAPSPTGELHIGGARTALFAYLFAKHHGGDFLLRIEDTDRTRFVEGSEDRILEGFAWLGITPDEGPGEVGGDYGPYRQSERLPMYEKAAEELLKKGSAYHCFCTTDRLDGLRASQKAQGLPTRYDGHCLGVSLEEARERIAKGEQSVIRLKMPRSGKCVFKDMVRGKVSFDYKGFDDSVIVKSDGFPTYHLASVVDDHAMEISHVLRAEEWLPSTPKHLALYEAFGWDAPVFAHVSFIVNETRRKLSKREDGEAVWLETYRKLGYLPEALINYLVLLGWNPKTTEEVFSVEELIKRFDGKGLNKAGAIFDQKRLDFVSSAYLKKMSVADFSEQALPYLQQQEWFSLEVLKNMDEKQQELMWSIEQQHCNCFSDVGSSLSFLFAFNGDYDAKMLIWRKSDRLGAIEQLDRAFNFLESSDSAIWTSAEELQSTIFSFLEEQDIAKGDFLWPLRVALTGLQHSPSPFECLMLLGQEESLSRIKHALELLRSV